MPPNAFLNPLLGDFAWMGAMRTDPTVKDRSWRTIRGGVSGRYRQIKHVNRFRFADRVPPPYNHRPPKRPGRLNPNPPPY